MTPTRIVMAGLVPAIGHGTLPLRMAGTSPAMTINVKRQTEFVVSFAPFQ
jgi:hypothetical protein